MAVVIGRERELARVEGLLEDATSRARAAILVGPAGAGKTTLWQAGVRFATERSCRVLRAQPSSAETRLSYSALCDLLAEVEPHEMAGLSEPQRQALAVALARELPGPEPTDPRTIAVGFTQLLRQLATSAPPLIVAVDDLQWLDGPSAFMLSYAARRLTNVPIRLLACVRRLPSDRRPEILANLDAWDVDEIDVGPMSVGAIFELIRERLDIRLPRPVLLRIHATSAGNPWVALELARAIDTSDHPGGAPLPLPRSLDDLTRARLEPLSSAARTVLLAAAAMSDPTRRLVLAASGANGTALDEALAAGAVEVDGPRLRFAHPLLASAAYAMASPEARQSIHRRLARLVTDPEESARHLALASPRPAPRVAAALDAGAQRARDRGAPGSEAELAEQAARLTPPERRADRRTRLIRSARAHAEAGDPGHAIALLTGELRADNGAPAGNAAPRVAADEAASVAADEAAPSAAPAADDAEILVALGEIEVHGIGIAQGVARYRRALECHPSVALEARIHTDLASAFADSFELDLARGHAAKAVETASSANDRSLVWRALTTAAYVATITASPDAGDLLRRALEVERPEDAIHELRSARFVMAFRAMYEDRLGEAREVMGRLAEAATAAETPAAPGLVAYQCLIELRADRFTDAVRLADTAFQLSLQNGRESTLTLAAHLRAQALAHLGDVKGARSVAATVEQSAERTGQTHRLGLVDQGMLGFLALSLDDPEVATRILDPAATTLHAIDRGEPSLFTFLPDAIEAAIAVGRLERADEILRWIEEPAERLGRTWALLSAARCRGELEAARGRDREALEAFERALDIQADLPAPRPFEHARTLFALGSFRRRRHEKALARETLLAARALFVETGARLWVARTDAEIGRIGGRRAATSGLSAMESRIAAQVAAGHTNKEIAVALGISPKTVAWNLSKAYEKLGVTTRTELAVRFASDGYSRRS